MSKLSKRAKRRMRGRAKREPVVAPVPTSGYYVLRRGSLFVATSWKFFSDPNFTMKGIAHDRSVAIELFRKSQNKGFRRATVPAADEFKDHSWQKS